MLSISVYDFIKIKIASMEYAPGSSFSEMELAKELGTPRAKVREAFSLLEQDNLIQIIPQRCTTICKLDLPSILDSIFIVRSILIAIVKEALLQPLENKPMLLQLRECLSAMENGVNYSNYEFFKVDHQFYSALAELNGFQRLNKIILKEKINIDRTLRLSLGDRGDYVSISRIYVKVIDGLLSGDFDKPIKALFELASALEVYANQAIKKYPSLFK
jgi:DNA-binding GntR family transcriptional regulator